VNVLPLHTAHSLPPQYKILLTAVAASLWQHKTHRFTLAALASALLQGGEAVSKYGGAVLGSRTMLDALLPAAKALQAAAQANQPAAQAATSAAAAAAAGAEATKGMAAAAGRSSYVPGEALAGNADPGAQAVAVWVAAVAGALGGSLP
jgi:dihydroxyacetone kinase